MREDVVCIKRKSKDRSALGWRDATIQRCWQERVSHGRILRQEGGGQPTETIEHENRAIELIF